MKKGHKNLRNRAENRLEDLRMSLHGVCMIVYESSKISHPGISSSDLTTRLNFIAGRVPCSDFDAFIFSSCRVDTPHMRLMRISPSLHPCQGIVIAMKARYATPRQPLPCNLDLETSRPPTSTSFLELPALGLNVRFLAF
jgi:hypothetical protein